MSINTRTKGYRNEDLVRNMYKNNGYDTYRAPNVRGGDTDMFNLWDLIIHDKENVKFIQVKSTLSGVSFFKSESYLWLCSKSNSECDYIIILIQDARKKLKNRMWQWCHTNKVWVEVEFYIEKSMNTND